MRLFHAAVLLAVSKRSLISRNVRAARFSKTASTSPWSVVEGEYGLNRPSIVNPTIIYRTPPVVVPYPGRAALGPRPPPLWRRSGLLSSDALDVAVGQIVRYWKSVDTQFDWQTQAAVTGIDRRMEADAQRR
jgi:hypothetical protein